MNDLEFFEKLFRYLEKVLHIVFGVIAVFITLGILFAEGFNILPLIVLAAVYGLFFLQLQIYKRLTIRNIVMAENVNEIIVLLEKKFGEETKE